MNLRKLIKGLISPALGLSILFGIGTGINAYYHHNIDYQTNNGRVMKKLDGPLSFTEIEISGDYISMNRRSLFNAIFGDGGYTTYEDYDNDEKVDQIFKSKNMFSRNESYESYFHRDKNSLAYKNADKEFKEQMQRFGIHNKD